MATSNESATQNELSTYFSAGMLTSKLPLIIEQGYQDGDALGQHRVQQNSSGLLVVNDRNSRDIRTPQADFFVSDVDERYHGIGLMLKKAFTGVLVGEVGISGRSVSEYIPKSERDAYGILIFWSKNQRFKRSVGAIAINQDFDQLYLFGRISSVALATTAIPRAVAK